MTQAGRQKVGKDSFGFLLQTLARKMDVRMKDHLDQLGIDVKIFANLIMLAKEDGINQRHLGKKLGFPDYFTSRNIDALVEAGLAERKPDPKSRRSHLVFLTDLGREKATALPAQIQICNDEFLVSLSAKEKDTLITLLQKVAGVAPG